MAEALLRAVTAVTSETPTVSTMTAGAGSASPAAVSQTDGASFVEWSCAPVATVNRCM